MNRVEALQHGNEVRRARAKLKREIKTGKVSVAEVLREVPGYAGKMSMEELLRTVKGLGPSRIVGICEQVRVSPLEAIGDVDISRRRLITGLVQRWER